MVERGNFGRKSSSLKLNGSPLGNLTFQWFKRLPRAHSVGAIIVKIMNQLLDVRQLLVEVLEVGPCLLVFLIFLIFLILFHNTSFDNLKAEKLRTNETSKCSPRSSSPWIPHCPWKLAWACSQDEQISCWPRPERCVTCDSERRTCWSRLYISVSGPKWLCWYKPCKTKYYYFFSLFVVS